MGPCFRRGDGLLGHCHSWMLPVRTDHRPAREATHSISISIAGLGSALTTQVVRAGNGGGPNAEAYNAFIGATSDARGKSTLTLPRSRRLAPASSSTRLM